MDLDCLINRIMSGSHLAAISGKRNFKTTVEVSSFKLIRETLISNGLGIKVGQRVGTRVWIKLTW